MPDDAGHLVAVQFDDSPGDLDLRHELVVSLSQASDGTTSCTGRSAAGQNGYWWCEISGRTVPSGLKRGTRRVGARREPTWALHQGDDLWLPLDQVGTTTASWATERPPG